MGAKDARVGSNRGKAMAQDNQPDTQAAPGGQQGKPAKAGRDTGDAQQQERLPPTLERMFLRDRLFPEAGAMFTFCPRPLDQVKLRLPSLQHQIKEGKSKRKK